MIKDIRTTLKNFTPYEEDRIYNPHDLTYINKDKIEELALDINTIVTDIDNKLDGKVDEDTLTEELEKKTDKEFTSQDYVGQVDYNKYAEPHMRHLINNTQVEREIALLYDVWAVNYWGEDGNQTYPPLTEDSHIAYKKYVDDTIDTKIQEVLDALGITLPVKGTKD